METLLPFALFIGISTVVYLVVTKWDRVVSSAQNHWQEQWRKQRQADLQIAPPPVRSEEEEIERLKLRQCCRHDWRTLGNWNRLGSPNGIWIRIRYSCCDSNANDSR